MKLTTSRKLSASAADLWFIVSDPKNMPAWNEKRQAIESVHGSGTGTRFKAQFSMRMEKKPEPTEGAIIEWKEYERITYRFQFPKDDPQLGSVDETYAIKQISTHQYQLSHTVDFKHSGLPRWVKFLIGILGRFGKSMGPDPLDGIVALLQGSR
jgi:uncharacterized protein YndB with AHSA1/START domain